MTEISPCLKIELWDTQKVVPYEKNVKNHDKKQVEKIANSIKQYGWDQPIVVDKDGVIIKGHGRREAAIFLGLPQVPVLVRSDLSEDEVKAARLADNRVAISDIDTIGLQEELRNINLDLHGIFDDKELNFLLDADLSEIKDEVLTDDLYGDLEAKAVETAEKVEKAKTEMVPIAEVLGFKAISGKDERSVVRFMARIEGDTGLVGAEAFVAFVNNYIND